MNGKKLIFLGYPFGISEIKSAVERAALGLAEVQVAADRLESIHLLDKIERMMAESHLCLFDATTHNVNVAIEYGIARGRRLNHRLLYCTDVAYVPKNHAPDVFTDLKGIDSIRYSAFNELDPMLRAHLPKLLANAIPQLDEGRPGPRLQLRLQTNAITDRASLEGDLVNTSASAANRVRLWVSGVGDASHALGVIRCGTLTLSDKPFHVSVPYENQPLRTNRPQFPIIGAEFVDDAGRRFIQRGDLDSHGPDASGRFTYSLDGLGAPQSVEHFIAKYSPLEDP